LLLGSNANKHSCIINYHNYPLLVMDAVRESGVCFSTKHMAQGGQQQRFKEKRAHASAATCNPAEAG